MRSRPLDKITLSEFCSAIISAGGILKNTPIPNKISLYGIQVGVRMPYFGCLYAIFSAKSIDFTEGQRIPTPESSFYSKNLGHVFC